MNIIALRYNKIIILNVLNNTSDSYYVGCTHIYDDAYANIMILSQYYQTCLTFITWVLFLKKD